MLELFSNNKAQNMLDLKLTGYLNTKSRVYFFSQQYFEMAYSMSATRWSLLFILTRNLIMIKNNNVHFILSKTYRSIFTLDEEEINIENYWHYLKVLQTKLTLYSV